MRKQLGFKEEDGKNATAATAATNKLWPIIGRKRRSLLSGKKGAAGANPSDAT
jgi:hypothetical protein